TDERRWEWERNAEESPARKLLPRLQVRAAAAGRCHSRAPGNSWRRDAAGTRSRDGCATLLLQKCSRLFGPYLQFFCPFLCDFAQKIFRGLVVGFRRFLVFSRAAGCRPLRQAGKPAATRLQGIQFAQRRFLNTLGNRFYLNE